MAQKFEDANSLIGAGSVFEGKFYVHGSLQISGKFEGEIHTEDHLMITETGKVKTHITAKKVTIGGTLIGNIEAEEEVTLLTTGQIMGNIKAPVLNIQKGAIHHGEIRLTGGQSKNVDRLIKESYSSVPGYDDYKSKEGSPKKGKIEKKERS